MDKQGFMEVLSNNGFSPINEGGCIMIVTPDKGDQSKMETLAKTCGYAGKGSYGWRKTKSSKTEEKANAAGDPTEPEKEPVYSEEEKKTAMQRARDYDMFELNFLETIQNEEWYDDTKRVLKEYAKFLDDPDEYMTTLTHH